MTALANPFARRQIYANLAPERRPEEAVADDEVDLIEGASQRLLQGQHLPDTRPAPGPEEPRGESGRQLAHRAHPGLVGQAGHRQVFVVLDA